MSFFVGGAASCSSANGIHGPCVTSAVNLYPTESYPAAALARRRMTSARTFRTVFSRSGSRLSSAIVFNHRNARLPHCVPAAVGLLGEPEAVATHDSAVLQGRAMAHFTTLAHHCVRMGEEVVTDARVAIDDHKAVQHSVLPDLHALVHEAVRSNVCPRPDPSRSGHHRRGMHAGDIARRLVEEFDGAGKVKIRILRAQGS